MRFALVMVFSAGAAVLFPACVSAPRYTAARGTSSEAAADVGRYEEGVASYYADEFHGRTTSNGEIFNKDEYTAAHRTLPFHSMVRVTNTLNGKSVVVRINDRGPFVGDRVIDLSLAAAKAIGMIGTGTAPVILEVISVGELRK